MGANASPNFTNPVSPFLFLFRWYDVKMRWLRLLDRAKERRRREFEETSHRAPASPAHTADSPMASARSSSIGPTPRPPLHRSTGENDENLSGSVRILSLRVILCLSTNGEWSLSVGLNTILPSAGEVVTLVTWTTILLLKHLQHMGFLSQA